MFKARVILVVLSLVWCVGIAHADLVGLWTLNEGQGTVTADSSGSGNDGTFEGSPLWVPGQYGFGVELDGSSSINLGDAPELEMTGPMTVACWVNSGDLTGDRGFIARNASYAFKSSGTSVRFTTPGILDHTGGNTTLETGVWAHVAVTFDPGAAGGAVFYLNGVETDRMTASAINAGSGPAEIGHNQWGQFYVGQIDEVAVFNHILTAEEIQAAMSGLGNKELATTPNPEEAAHDVLRDSLLSWKPGAYAVQHNVYVGASFEDVNSATVPTATGLDANSFDPGRLDFGQTYFWRVDEVNGTPDKTVFKGEIWSFTAEPYSILIPGSEIIVSASSSSNDFSLPEKVIDGSGIGPDGSCATTPETMWFTASPDMNPWIQFEFSDLKQLDTMKIWNSNGAAESAIGWGVKDVVIEYSEDGENWTVLEGASQFSRAPGLVTYDQPDEIAFNGVPARMVRLNIASNWGGILMSYSLSEVQFNMIPAQARTPVPAAGSASILPDAVATWRAGRSAAQHTIYVDTDADAVADGSAPSTTTSTNSLDLSTLDLQLGETYYWRVDEVNEAEAVPVWEGPVWSLSITSAVVVDDFEGYGNASPDRPFQTWLDGFGYSADEFFSVAYGGNGTGAGIGHDIWSLSSPHYDGDIMETMTAINGSNQSMPFYFSNTGGVASQTDRTFTTPQNWIAGGITTLTVAVHGDPSIAAANQLYVKINGTKVMYDGELSVPIWQQWQVDLTTLGINLSSVTTMSFGVDGSGSGMVLLDDILLHRTAPPVLGPPPGGDKSLVAHWTFDETEGLTAADSSGYGNDGQLVGMTGTEWTAGLSGGALEFSGAVGSEQYVDFGTGDSLQLAGSVTISAWAKMNAGTEAAYMGIGGKLKTAPYQGFSLVRHSSGVFRLWADDGNGVIAGFEADSDVTYTDTEWHHVAGVVDAGLSTLYVDGVKQAKTGAVNLTDSGEPAHIGRQYYGLDDRYWNGVIDDVRIYYRALSEQEIQGL